MEDLSDSDAHSFGQAAIGNFLDSLLMVGGFPLILGLRSCASYLPCMFLVKRAQTRNGGTRRVS